MAKIKVFEPAPDPPKPPKARKTHFSAKGKTKISDQQFPCQWRDVQFPASDLRVSLVQDQAQHKYWGVDSADVESTGRAPLEIEATIPFFNGIVPSPIEKWGVLYPDGFRQFLDACYDPTSGVLDTPEVAGLVCKAVSVEWSHDPMRRDGVEVKAKWIETIDIDRQPDVDSAPINVAGLAALDLDMAAAEAQDVEELPRDIGFERLVNELAGAIDTTASRVSLLLNKPKQILYRIERVQDSVERAKNALLWPIEDAAERMKAAIHDMTGTTVEGIGPPPAPRRKTARYVARERAHLATFLSIYPIFPNNSLDDLLYLNPRLASRPTVPAGSVIRYYL